MVKTTKYFDNENNTNYNDSKSIQNHKTETLSATCVQFTFQFFERK